MNRSQRRKLIYQVTDTLDICSSCRIKEDMLQGSSEDATVYSKFQKYCNTECSIGQKLQSLGTQLGNSGVIALKRIITLK